MSEATDDAVKLLEETPTALFITFIREDRIDSRLIGPFVSDGLKVYIFTSKSSNKIKQIGANPCVSLYLQNEFENPVEYKSLLINGKATEVTDDTESEKVKNGLKVKSRAYKEWIDNDGWDKWTIIKVEPESIKYIDNSKSPTPEYIDLTGESSP